MAGESDATVDQRKRTDPAGDSKRDATPTLTLPPEAQPPTARSSLTAGAASSRYVRGAEIGRGGMGRVLEATDTVLGRTVAVKEIVEVDSDLARRFEREVFVTARLEHPSIVPIYDAGRTEHGLPFYVMRRIGGSRFDLVIAEAAGLDGRLALIPSLLAAVDAIAHAHRRGVVHRDLKPGNILVGEHGETLVIDWGLAKLLVGDDHELEPGATPRPQDSLQTLVGSVVGTPGFMAPEQALGGDVDARGDVYALGAILYQLLAGHAPWEGTKPSEILDRVIDHAPPPVTASVRGVPPDLLAILDRAMAPARDARYADASALGDDLRRFLRGQLVAAHVYSRRERLVRWMRRHRVPLAVAGTAVIALAIVGALSVSRMIEDRDRIAAARAVAEDIADERLIDTARASLDRDPSHAIARLLELAPMSRRWSSARAVVLAARSRGILYAFAGLTAPLLSAVVSPDGTRIAAAAGTGPELLVHDAATRTTSALAIRSDGIAWLGDHLVTYEGDAITVHGGRTYRAAGHIVSLERADGGSAVAWRTRDQITIAGLAGEPVVLDGNADALSCKLAADGNVLVVRTALGLRIHRHAAAGTWPKLQEILAATTALVVSDDGSRIAFAVEGAARTVQIEEWLLSGETFTRHGAWPAQPRSELLYAGTHLAIVDSDRLRWVELDRMGPFGEDKLDGAPFIGTAFGPAEVAYLTHARDRLVLSTPDRRLVIPLPEIAVRVVVRGRRWVFVATTAHVFVVDLEEVWPRVVGSAAQSIAPLSQRTTMIISPNQTRLVDEASGELHDLPDIGRARVVADVATGRLVMVHDHRVHIVSETGITSVIEIPNAVRAVLRGPHAVVVLTEAGELLEHDLTTHTARSLVRFPAAGIDLVARGEWLVVMADNEVWRTDGTHEQRARLDEAARAVELAADGTAYFGVGARVMRWSIDGASVEVARLPVELNGLGPLRGNALLALGKQGELYEIDVHDGKVTSPLPASQPPAVTALDGTLGARITPGGDIEVADLVNAGDRFTLPTSGMQPGLIAFSPAGDAIYAKDGGGHVVRFPLDLVRAPDELRAWITARTNATTGPHGAIGWQLPVARPGR